MRAKPKLFMLQCVSRPETLSLFTCLSWWSLWFLQKLLLNTNWNRNCAPACFKELSYSLVGCRRCLSFSIERLHLKVNSVLSVAVMMCFFFSASTARSRSLSWKWGVNFWHLTKSKFSYTLQCHLVSLGCSFCGREVVFFCFFFWNSRQRILWRHHCLHT